MAASIEISSATPTEMSEASRYAISRCVSSALFAVCPAWTRCSWKIGGRTRKQPILYISNEAQGG
ncbi:MAG: hypothetical protein M3Y71_07835 [Actinomycetota bacterium]|nr:hypothetical protein [Actinomycetota bacterium]